MTLHCNYDADYQYCHGLTQPENRVPDCIIKSFNQRHRCAGWLPHAFNPQCQLTARHCAHLLSLADSLYIVQMSLGKQLGRKGHGS